ncbi:hypothetical protein DERP_001600 [Dermatophagoides pteronyssinus]|uniref:Uncharacterized protein n=1 Tax=Dermatophagoides pteronyssinus TaxID=6956 RepID=A0ABQ8JAZ9_DERPT|nr:hypothetical protein DERP_001600 [Dermatophagoides pteronyssinus]
MMITAIFSISHSIVAKKTSNSDNINKNEKEEEEKEEKKQSSVVDDNELLSDRNYHCDFIIETYKMIEIK